MITRIPIMQTSIREDYPHNLLLDVISRGIEIDYRRTEEIFNIDVANLTADQLAGLEYAISQLSEPVQQVIDLVYRQNYSLTQIASALKKSSSTIAAHRRHGVSILSRPEYMHYIRYGKEAWSQKLAADERIQRDNAEREEILSRERIRLGTCAVIPLNTLRRRMPIPYDLKDKGYRTFGDIMNAKPEDFYEKSGMKKKDADALILAVRDMCRKYADNEPVWDNGTCPICKFIMPADVTQGTYNFCPHCGTRLNPEYGTGTK